MEDEGPLFSQWMVASRKSRRRAPLCYSNLELHWSVGSLVQGRLGGGMPTEELLLSGRHQRMAGDGELVSQRGKGIASKRQMAPLC